jgi:flagellin-like protein
MQNENRNDEAVSPVIATILMVAITVVLAGVLYVWAASLAEGNTDGNLTLYSFDGEDAGGQTSDATNDTLIFITMNQGVDLNWASVSVKISIDNNNGDGFGAPETCSNGDASGNCDLVEFGTTGDQFWSVGDGVTVYESGQALCEEGEVCKVKVSIIDTREGKELATFIATAE